MKPIPQGYEEAVGVVVTEEMTVDFSELGRVHPVYATYWMAKHMEEAGRKIILPFLEDGDEGIGSAVSVQHLGPALVGMRVEIVARHVRTEGPRIFVECNALSELGDLIGTGSTEQFVLAAPDLEARFAEVQERWGNLQEAKRTHKPIDP